MIYFLVNNTFHLHDVNDYLKEIKNQKIRLIQVPYSLKPIEKNPRIDEIYIFERLAYVSEYLKDWPEHLFPLINQIDIRSKLLRKQYIPKKMIF